MLPVLSETTIQTLDIYVQTAVSGASVRAALYSTSTDGGIAELLLDFGAVDCSSSGIKTFNAAAPVTLAADMYYVVLIGSDTGLRFRGDYFGRADVFASSGHVSGVLTSASRGRIVFLNYNTDFPSDMSNFTIGTSQNQVQFLGSWACPNVILRQ